MSKEDQFIEACKNNNIKKIKKLVYDGVNIHESNDAGFKWACCTGCIEIVIYLTTLHQITFTNGIKYNMIDINSQSEYCFRWACYEGYIKIIYYLIKLHKKHKYYKPINIYDKCYYGDCMKDKYPVKLIMNLGNYKEKLINLFI